MKAEKENTIERKIAFGPIANEKISIVVPTDQVKIHETTVTDTLPSENGLNDTNPIIFKSFSGDLKIALNQKVIEEISKNLQRGSNVYVGLRKTDNGKLLFSIHSDVSIVTHDKVFLPKKSPSGNIILEAFKPIHGKAINNLNKELCDKMHDVKREDECNLVHFKGHNCLDRKDVHNLNSNKPREQKHESEKSHRIHKVEVKGINFKNPGLYALNETRSGNYQIVLDKEYERFNKQVIKDYEGDCHLEYVQLMNSESGHFILNFEENHNKDAKKALIVKTESGNLNVLINKLNTNHLSNISNSKVSIITANALSELLSKSVSLNKEFHMDSTRSSRLLDIKSNSDSNLYKKDKISFSVDNNKEAYNEDIGHVKMFESKAIATSCNGRCHDNSCNRSKCVCKNLCYKSKQWFWENSIRDTNKKICGINNVQHDKNFFQSYNTNEFILYKRDDELEILKNPPHKVKIPCGGCLAVDKVSQEHKICDLNDSCPYGIDNYESIPSDLLKTSNSYSKKYNIDEYDLKKLNESKLKNQNYLRWDSMEHFPPQLPSFLRDFTFI